MRASNAPLLLSIAGLAVIGMAVLNKLQYESRPMSAAEIRAEEERRRATTTSSTTPATSESEGPAVSALKTLEPEKFFGSEPPLHEVTIGYKITPAIEAKSQDVAEALHYFTEALERVNGKMSLNARFRLVNTEKLPGTQDGIWIDERYLTTFNLSNLRAEGTQLVSYIVRELKQSPPPSKKPTPRKKQG